MNHEITVSPSGRLRLVSDDPQGDGDSAGIRRLVKAFSASSGEGLFRLAANRLEAGLAPSLGFWRDFAVQRLTELCHTPRTDRTEIEPAAPLSQAQTGTLLLSAPPIRGAEYLTAEVFNALWRELDQWVRDRVAETEGGLSAFLARQAPMWRQVGRVCFHLAENKRDDNYPFAFIATYAPGLSQADRVQYQPLSKAMQEYAGAKNRKALIHLLSPVHLASESSPLVKELVDSGDLFHPLAWTPAEAHRFLKDVPLFEDCGILVRLPDWWRKRPRPRVSVTIGQKKRKTLGAEAMLDFDVTLALGDRTLSQSEWDALLSGDEGLVMLRGQWVEVDREKLASALDHWTTVASKYGAEGVSFIEGMRLLAGATADFETSSMEDRDHQWSFVQTGRWLRETLARLRDPSEIEQAQPGEMLNATLRPYQETGLGWLWLMSGLRLGACLADDMGLGKTIQVLALLVALKRTGRKKAPALLVLPASLLANWKAEMTRFAPGLSARFVHPSEADAGELAAMAQDPAGEFANVDAVLTTYGMLLRRKWLLDMEWGLVVLDEAQAIKNPSTRQSRAVKKIKSLSRIALTGTPVENRLGDLWSMFDFLCPGLLGSARKFKLFVKAMERRQTERYTPLRNLVAPYILRRLKTDRNVIADLPDKTEVSAFCGLTKPQAALYAGSVAQMTEQMKETSGIQRRGLVLSYIMRFKQICNHPSQLLGDGAYDPGDSGKFERIGEICMELASRQEKALVFTQFREITGPLQAFLSGVFGRPGLVLHGGTPVARRKKLVDQFQQEDGPPFFVLSLKAGGTGLNLTAAAHVIHFDRWWNPAVENQATDRAFRIGQKQNVMVHKFVCRGTIEEKINAMIEEKQELARDVLEGGAMKMLTEMSDEELLDLVTLDVDKAMI